MSDQTTIEVVLSSESTVGNPIVETVTVVGTVPIGPRGPAGADSTVPGPEGPQGDPGEGVATGGSEGQVLAKASAADFDTEWVTVPTAEVTQAELDAEASARAAADTALDTRVDALEAVDPLTQTEGDARYWPLTTDLATQVELNTEATTRGNADTALDGRLDTAEATLAGLGDLAVKDQVTVADIDATGTPDGTTFLRGDGTWNAPAGGGSGVVETIVPGSNIDVDATDPANPIVSVEALSTADISGLGTAATTDATDYATAAQGATADSAMQPGDAAGGVLSGTYPNPGFAADMATQAELDAHAADTTSVHGIADTAALETTSGAQSKADAKVDDTAYDATSWNAVTGVAPSKNAVRDYLETLTGTTLPAAYQPLDADLTALAAANNSTVLAATTASFLTADETKLDGIEAGAEVNDSASEILTKLLTVDGAGSGLDADLLDGQSSAAFASASGLSDHLADTSDAHDASAISYAGGTGMSATDVEAAIDELATEKADLASPTFTGEPVAPSVQVTGKTGATATPIRLAGGTASGAPASGAHLKGEIVFDDAGVGYYCTVAGTPGTWVSFGGGGGATVNDQGTILGVDSLETTGTWAANTAYFYRVFVPCSVTVNRIGVFIGTQSGNIDVGIYADDGTGTSPGSRIVSSGSTACGAGSTVQTITIADTTLAAGCYWVAFAPDNASVVTPKSTLAHQIWHRRAQSKASSFPLPSTVSALTTNAALHGCWLETR